MACETTCKTCKECLGMIQSAITTYFQSVERCVNTNFQQQYQAVRDFHRRELQNLWQQQNLDSELIQVETSRKRRFIARQPALTDVAADISLEQAGHQPQEMIIFDQPSVTPSPSEQTTSSQKASPNQSQTSPSYDLPNSNSAVMMSLQQVVPVKLFYPDFFDTFQAPTSPPVSILPQSRENAL